MAERKIDGSFRVGAWEVDPASREIRPADAVASETPTSEALDSEAVDSRDVQRLGHKPLTVLQCLAAMPGTVVTKDELIEKVWDGAATTDDAVMAVVYELRKALGDDARSPRYVETIRQRGYRLVADVTPLPTAEAGAESGAESVAESGVPDGFGSSTSDSAVPEDLGTSPQRSGRRLRPIVPVLGLGLMLALALIWFDAANRAERSGETTAGVGSVEEPATQRAEEQVEEIPDIRSLAIRPLAAFGDQCLEEPFVDSLTELLIAELVDGPPLEILGAGDGTPWPSEPTADAVIEGSIIRSGEGLWVNVRLVESSTGRLIWGASYERHGADLLLERALASQIARDVEGLMERNDLQ